MDLHNTEPTSPSPASIGLGGRLPGVPGRDRHGAFDQNLLSDIVSGRFAERTAALLRGVDDQIATSTSPLLAVHIRYQLEVEQMQALVERLSRLGAANLGSIALAVERAGSEMSASADSGVRADTPSQRRVGTAWGDLTVIPNWVAERSATVSDPGTSLFPIIYASPRFLDGHPAAELKLLRQWYAPTTLPGRYLLTDREALAADSGTAKRLYEIVNALSGHDQATVASVLDKFGGHLPLALGPLRLEVKNGAWFSVAKHPHLRVPFGALPSSREFLSVIQNEIESGSLAGHTLQVAGRISLDFLTWATGKGIHDPGPIPDIEILYALPLASGKLHRVILKPARNFTQRTQSDYHQLTREDAQTISALERYFLDPERRRTPKLLADFVPEHFPPELQPYVGAPWMIPSFSEYQQFRVLWYQSLLQQLAEAADTRSKVISKADSRTRKPSSMEEFRSALIERIRTLPDEQQFYPAALFRLTLQQEQEFVQRYLPLFYRIVTEERERVVGESVSGAHRRRVERGYCGPEEGYALPIDYMIMDMIISMRRREAFRERRSVRDLVSADETIVPDRIGRSYENPERFSNLQDLPRLLEASTAKPSVSATVLDPYSKDGVVVIEGEDAVRKFASAMVEENLKRILPSLARKLLHLRDQGKQGKLIPREAQLLRVFRSFSAQIRGEIRMDRAKIHTLEVTRANALASLSAELKSQSVSRSDYGTAMLAAKAEYQRQIDRLKVRIRQGERGLLSVYQELDPSGAKDACLRLVSVVDQHIVKFQFGIGADENCVIDEEKLGAQGLMRRTHSEALGGRNMYVGGELIFARWRESFVNFERWIAFADARKSDPTLLAKPWSLVELNNMSGHYQPDPVSLTYGRNVVFPKLASIGISTADAHVVDRLSPGLRMRGVVPYRF